MKKHVWLAFLAAFCFNFIAFLPLFAQKKAGKLTRENIEKLAIHEDTLSLMAFTVINDSLEKHRFAACKKLITNLVASLKIENSFRYKFERLKSVSIQYPADSSFRIFTWQLFVNDSTYRYYGAIQLNEPQLKLFPLTDRSFEIEDAASFEVLPPERWYGAVYYRISDLDGRDGKKYLLYGFDAFSFFEKRKVLDVLSFQDGKPVFGAPIFQRGAVASAKGLPESRLILTYMSEVKVRLNFDDQYGMILFDHLLPEPSPFKSGETTYVPDGSYEGFKIEKGKLIWIEKVFNDKQDEAPRPEPVLDRQKGKTIFGKQKGD